MGWMVSPKLLLLIVCVYDAWVVSEDIAPTKCPKEQIFCGVLKACSTKRECDAACPKDQSFCLVTKQCTTKAKCDAAVEERKQLEDKCTKENKMYCPKTNACSTPEKCREEATDEKEPPTCPGDEAFCPVLRECATQDECREATEMEREPPTCSGGEMFCKFTHNCTTQEICDAALKEREQLKKHCEAQDLMYCPDMGGCASQRECDDASQEREEECPTGQMFCRVIEDCTTQEKCDAAFKEREQLKKDCAAKDLIYCPSMNNCTMKGDCFGDKHSNYTRCGEDEKRCLTEEGVECILKDGDCVCLKDDMKYCDSVEHCIPVDKLKNGSCPVKCKKQEMFCPKWHKCVSEDVFMKAECSMRGSGDRHSNYTKCGEDEKRCLKEEGVECILKDDDCPCLKEDMKYCDSVEHCIPVEKLKNGSCPECKKQEMFCPKWHKCVSEDMFMKADCRMHGSGDRHSNYTRCGEDEKRCLTEEGVECILKDEDCVCLKEDMKYCDSVEHCIPVDKLKNRSCPVKCKKEEMFCPKWHKCVSEDMFMKADCRLHGSGDRHSNYTRCGEDEKRCPTEEGVECILKDEDCPCLKEDMKYCDSVEHCIPVEKLKNGSCPECKKQEMFCPKWHKCVSEDVFMKADCRMHGSGDKHSNYTRCGEDEKRCLTEEGVECIPEAEDCLCLKEDMKYCDSVEHCIPVEKLKNGSCPECKKQEMYCPKLEKCLIKDVFETECGMIEEESCVEGEVFCRTSGSCVGKGKMKEQCSPEVTPPPESCGKGEKQCITRAGSTCVSEREECPCAKGMKYCDSVHTCLPEESLKNGKCPPKCDKLKMYCPKLEKCLSKDEFKTECGMIEEESCSEGEVFCRTSGSCVEEGKMKEQCSPDVTPPPESCGKGEKQCITRAGSTCVPEKEECPCAKGMKYCDSVHTCLPEKLLKNGKCPPKCDKPKLYCLSSGKCLNEDEMKECGVPGGTPLLPCRKGDPTCTPPTGRTLKPGVSTKPPKNKDDYFFFQAISANLAKSSNRGRPVGEILKKIRFKEAVVEGSLKNVAGNWQVLRDTVGTRVKAKWTDLGKGKKMSPKDSIRFVPANASVHGFDGIEFKIGKVSKYIGIIVHPCVVPRLKVKKELSGREETPLKFNLDDVFGVTRARKKAMVSNLKEEYNEFVPPIVLSKYEEMLNGSVGGENLGIMVKSMDGHKLVKEGEKIEDSSDKKLTFKLPIHPIPKIFAVGSKLVFKPARDVIGVIKILVFPVDLPDTKDFKSKPCAVGEGVELIINIANVNDKPSPRPIDPSNPLRLKLIVSTPFLPYELADHAANEGFTVGKFAKLAGKDVDGDTLGIAVVKAEIQPLGVWQYLDDGDVWQNIDMSGGKRFIQGNDVEALFLPPLQKLRFKPKELSKFWRKNNQQTLLRVHLWDQSDGLGLGLRNVTKGNDAISSEVLSSFMERLGCDGRPGSGLVLNECNECGKKSCRKCDGSTNSTAILNKCRVCVLGSTGLGLDEGKDCRGVCSGVFIRHKKCDKCVHPENKKVTDCSGSCSGTKRMSRCKVCSHDRNADADACGVCGGDNSTCTECDGKIRSRKRVDRCGKCLDPKSKEFHQSCINLAAISPKLHEIGKKMIYKLDASGFPESNASCEFRRGNVVVALEVLAGPRLVVQGIDTPGVYTLVCTISEKEYTLDKAVTVFSEKITVSGVAPSEVNVGANVSHVVVTGDGFLDSKDLWCIYHEVQPALSKSKKRDKRSTVPNFSLKRPAEFVSSTQCKCKISTLESRKVKISVTLNREESNPDSHVEVTVLKEATRIKAHKLKNKAKKIFITFTSAVKRVSGCKNIFAEATVDKLEELVGDGKFSCKTIRADVLVVHIPGAFIEDDLQLNFKSGAVEPSKGVSRSKELNVTIKAPAAKIIPIAVITAPKQVGSCDKIRISAKNSKVTGKGGVRRRWSVCIEGVTDEGTLDSDVINDLTALRNVLNTNRSAYVIPKTNVREGYNYEFKLVVSNREGSSLAVTHVIKRSEKDIPSVRFITKSKVFDLRRKQFVLKVVAKRPECVESKLVFSWSCISHPQLSLPNTGTRKLTLLREKMECDKNYEFFLEAYLDSDPTLRTALTYNFTTKSAPLKFGISGGDQVVPSNGIIRLKARATSKVTCGGDLQYIFSCTDEDGYPCLAKNKDGIEEELGTIERPTLRLRANRFVANQTYTFKLEVFKGREKLVRSVKVKIAPGTPPTVAIKKPKDGPNPIIVVVIKSSRKNTTSFMCEGVVEAGFGFIDLEDKTKVTGEVRGERMIFNQRRLRFSFKDLEAGVEYKVRCFAYHDNTPDEIGESTTTFKIESPPEGGVLTIEPEEGIALETVFSVVASEFISNSNSTIAYTFYTEMRRGKRRLLASKRTEQSIEVQLPAGNGADNMTTVVVVAENEFGRTVVKTKVKCLPKQYDVQDFTAFKEEMKRRGDEGATLEVLIISGDFIASADNQEAVKEELLELKESLSKTVVLLLAEKREDGSTDMSDLYALARDIEPQTDESKESLGKEMSGAVEETVPDTVKRRGDVVETGNQQQRRRRRRSIEENEESDDDDDDETGMSVDEIEDVLATFENLVDTTVINNRTENFIETIDSLLINMCKGLPLGETSVALSKLGVLKTDMNYLDDVDSTFLNMSCTNCSMLNHSALVKFGGELKQLYNEWNCSGDADDLCNGLCASMVQFPHDYITAVTSPVRLSDVIYVELKNPENQDYVPVSNLTQPALFHIPLHAGYSQTGGHKCMIWSESEGQWSGSGCQKTQALNRNGAVFVECSCTQLGYITVHQDDDDVTLSTQSQSDAPTQAPGGHVPSSNGSETTVKMSEVKQNHVANVQFSFDVDYNSVVRDLETRDKMMTVVEDEVASTMQVDKSMILNLTLSPGSIVVRFVLLAPDLNPTTSLNYSLTQLMTAVNEGKFTITFNNVQLTADNGTMTYEYKVMTDLSPDETGIVKEIEDDDESKLPIILGAVFGFLLIAVIVGAILFRRHLSSQAKVSHENIRGSQPINNNCAQNTAYQGSVGDNLGRPGTPGNAAPLEHKHSSGGSRSGSAGVRQTAELPHIE